MTLSLTLSLAETQKLPSYLEDVLLTLTSRVGDLAVIDDDTETTGTAIRLGPADALGELGVRVGQEEDVIVLDTVGLAPGTHDVGIIDGNDGDDIDALGLELGKLLNVLGHVSGRADGGKGTWEVQSDRQITNKTNGKEF